ncbi:methyltransferase domain-containing protein [Streptomyces sp. NPDC002133]|uniref:class I SAM-dependent methyltransferase n=1 Tax=Streptomyces sp. NPDC002133 TaxID=3154409 RepID=UPI0033303E5F
MPHPGFFVHRLPVGPVMPDRDALLLELCAGRRVLHIGCADSPLTAERLDDGSILHAKLLKTASAVLGSDIDARGVELLRERLGGEYAVMDVTDQDARSIAARFKPEIVLAGDVIEHVRDAASFLRGIADLMREAGSGAELILSTPNGLAFKGVVNTMKGLESIHPDHVYVFTPASLARLVSDCGLHPSRWLFYHVLGSGKRVRERFLRAASHAAVKLRPAFSEGLVLVCKESAP